MEFRRAVSRVAIALCGRGRMLFPWSMLRAQAWSTVVNLDGARPNVLRARQLCQPQCCKRGERAGGDARLTARDRSARASRHRPCRHSAARVSLASVWARCVCGRTGRPAPGAGSRSDCSRTWAADWPRTPAAGTRRRGGLTAAAGWPTRAVARRARPAPPGPAGAADGGRGRASPCACDRHSVRRSGMARSQRARAAGRRAITRSRTPTVTTHHPRSSSRSSSSRSPSRSSGPVSEPAQPHRDAPRQGGVRHPAPRCWMPVCVAARVCRDRTRP